MEQYVAYATLSLVQEMNSIFLHLRLILRMSGFSRNDNAYRLCSLVNIGKWYSTNIVLCLHFSATWGIMYFKVTIFLNLEHK